MKPIAPLVAPISSIQRAAIRGMKNDHLKLSMSPAKWYHKLQGAMMGGELHGATLGTGHIWVKNDDAPAEVAGTMFHEWAHALLHIPRRPTLLPINYLRGQAAHSVERMPEDTRLREVEAENVSNIMCRLLGIEKNFAASLDYLDNHAPERERRTQVNAARVEKCAEHMIVRLSETLPAVMVRYTEYIYGEERQAAAVVPVQSRPQFVAENMPEVRVPVPAFR